MHLAYRQAAPFTLVRDFLADVVGLVRPGTAGSWTIESCTPLPHEGHGPLDVLARTEWRLGEATLVQSIEGGDGNPRDGYGFMMFVELAVPGADGGLRRLSLHTGSWDPHPSELSFTLEGFTAAEFLQARAAGCARFVNDDTANPVWAAHNVEALMKLGERSVARQLLTEAVARPGPAWARSAQERLRCALVELGDDPARPGASPSSDPTGRE